MITASERRTSSRRTIGMIAPHRVGAPPSLREHKIVQRRPQRGGEVHQHEYSGKTDPEESQRTGRAVVFMQRCEDCAEQGDQPDQDRKVRGDHFLAGTDCLYPGWRCRFFHGGGGCPTARSPPQRCAYVGVRIGRRPTGEPRLIGKPRPPADPRLTEEPRLVAEPRLAAEPRDHCPEKRSHHPRMIRAMQGMNPPKLAQTLDCGR